MINFRSNSFSTFNFFSSQLSFVIISRAFAHTAVHHSNLLPGRDHAESSSAPHFPTSLSLLLSLADKLDAVVVFRKRKRLHSELDEDRGELSLTEYLRRKQEDGSKGRQKKRVGG